VDVVLLRPTRAGNVAAACRALKNMGLRSLALVEPPQELEETSARSLAYGAWDVLDAARRAASLEEAVSSATFVVATSGRAAEGAWTPRQLAERAEARCGDGRLAVVFGPEPTGLSLDELRLCHEVVRIPTDPAHSSLNLAQAVLLVAYEIFLAAALPDGGAAEPSPEGQRAAAGELEAALAELRQALLDVGYLNPQGPDAVFSELRRLLARAGPTVREVRLLRGLARQVGWAGRGSRG